MTVGRFAIRARLGAGGMGEVYRADDTRLKRPVALKRIAPRLRDDAQYRRRFLKEAERASGLSDHHIAGVYDVLDENGEIFLVMEYVEGATLRQRLREPLSIKEFLQIAVQCVEALVAAHGKGVLHCDIKPENIMLTPTSQVKVLDFGVAKRLSLPAEGAATESLRSMTGTLSGTLAYMAPEVLLEKEPDGRADIFSLGVVFYEALTGWHPFLAGSFMATSDRVLHEEPPPLTQLNPQAPPELERIVAKMLAKDPAERYATAADLLGDLRALQQTAAFPGPPPAVRRRQGKRRAVLGIAAPAALALLAIVAAVPAARRQFKHWLGIAMVPQEKQLAVLPFTAAGGDPEATAFANGLAETLTARLAQLTVKHSLEVVPASEVRARGVTSLRQAREEFGVNLGLEGSLHRSGEMVRVTYNLVDANTLRQLRGETITAKASDPFAIEDQVADRVVGALEIELQPQERRVLTAHGTTQPSAYDYYLQGRGYLQDYQKPENVESAVTVFNNALKLDPRYALAYAGLGDAYWQKYQQSKNSEWIERAVAACQQAVSLEGHLGNGHACLGTLYDGTGKYEQAVEEFRRAIRLQPTNDDAYRGLASAYQEQGKLDEAESTFRQAIRLRPQYWAGYNWLGSFYYRQARYAEAVDMFRQVVALAPDSFRGYSNLGGTYAAMGRYADAIPNLEKSVAIRPSAWGYANLATTYFYLRRFADEARACEQAVKLDERDYDLWGDLADAYYWAPGKRSLAEGAYRKAIELATEKLRVNSRDATLLGNLANYHAMLGEEGPALARLKQALALAPGDPDLLFKVALAYNQLGKLDEALGWLKKAGAAGLSATLVRDDPRFDNLHAQPRFQKLISKH